MKKHVFFDFDGTITTTDSFNDFIIWRFGIIQFLLCMLRALPDVIRYMFVDESYCLQVKERFLTRFYKGVPYDMFVKDAQAYAEKRLPDIVKKKALEKIVEHMNAGESVYIITASPVEWVSAWAAQAGVEHVIGSHVQVVDSVLTGLLETHCHGRQKVDEIKRIVPNRSHVYITAYGDSSSDLPMLKYADKAYYKDI